MHMELTRRAQILMLLCFLAACTGPEDRINNAIPVSQEVEFSRLKYIEAVKLSGSDLGEFEEKYKTQLKLRAISCSNGYQPSSFETNQSISEKFSDTACFAEADFKLNRWIGNKLIGVLLALPALRPISKDAPKTIISSEGIREVIFADEAGVAIIATHDGKARLINISDSSNIRLLEEDFQNDASLSPNGRLLAFRSRKSGSVDIYNTESGSRVTNLPEVATGKIFWIGGIGAVYQKKSTDSPVFIDFSSGIETLVPVSGQGELTLHKSNLAPNQYYFLTNSRIAIVSMRSSNNNKPEVIRESIVDSFRPMWRRSYLTGKDILIALSASGELLIIDSKHLEIKPIELKPFIANGAFAQAENPNGVILNGFVQGSSATRSSYFYDSAKKTLFPIIDQSINQNYPLIYIKTLKRNAIIDGNRVLVINTLKLGSAITLHDFTLQMQAESQIAILEEQAKLSEFNKMRKIISDRDAEKQANPTSALALQSASSSLNMLVPLPGEKGLNEALRKGQLRLGSKSDIARWQQAGGKLSGNAFESIILSRQVYVISKDFYIPTGLTGAHGVTFILERSVPFPQGDLGHSVILDLNTGGCLGKLCR